VDALSRALFGIIFGIVQKLVGPSAVFKKIAVITVYWIVSKWNVNMGDRVADVVIELLIPA
jgi:hypothetical protein